jgi:hypothetical protein
MLQLENQIEDWFKIASYRVEFIYMKLVPKERCFYVLDVEEKFDLRKINAL